MPPLNSPIAKAFNELRSLGYDARQNIPKFKVDRYMRSEKTAFTILNQGCDGKLLIHWKGNVNEIINIFKNHGVFLEWNGRDNGVIVLKAS